MQYEGAIVCCAGTGEEARVQEATAIAQLLANAVRTHGRATDLISAGRAAEAAHAAADSLQALSARGDMQVTTKMCDCTCSRSRSEQNSAGCRNVSGLMQWCPGRMSGW
jgi:hypothetical protein